MIGTEHAAHADAIRAAMLVAMAKQAQVEDVDPDLVGALHRIGLVFAVWRCIDQTTSTVPE